MYISKPYEEYRERKVHLIREINTGKWFAGTSCEPQLVDFNKARLFSGKGHARMFLTFEPCADRFNNLNAEIITYTLGYDPEIEIESEV